MEKELEQWKETVEQTLKYWKEMGGSIWTYGFNTYRYRNKYSYKHVHLFPSSVHWKDAGADTP